MLRRILAHVAAMRRQVRRIQRTAVIGSVVLAPCVVLLVSTLPTAWETLLVLVLVAGYVYSKIHRLMWTRRAMRQLRLEEQFIRHGPAAKQVQTCTRRPEHLWTNSLTMRGLKTLFRDPSARSAPAADQEEHIRRHYLRAFEAIQPSRIPVDLFWFGTLALLWLWFVPEALLQSMSTTIFVSVAFLLLLLVSEVVQAILNADLRGGFAHFAALLTEWTLDNAVAEVLFTPRKKPYRHTPIYRSWLFRQTTNASAGSNAAARSRPVSPLPATVQTESED